MVSTHRATADHLLSLPSCITVTEYFELVKLTTSDVTLHGITGMFAPWPIAECGADNIPMVCCIIH